MAVKIGLNGFGRIGRLAARILTTDVEDLELVVINAPGPADQLAHLLKFDTVHRTFIGQVDHEEDSLIVEGRRIAICHHSLPGQTPWGDYGVDIVLESVGKFASRAHCSAHLSQGAKKVVLSAPSGELDLVAVMGVNHTRYDGQRHHLISAASSTTNALAPLAKVLNQAFGLEHGLITTIHSYTMTQKLLDEAKEDVRRGRAATENLVPTTTGAIRATGQVLPELKGKLDGVAVRVPVPDVSLLDLTCRLGKKASPETVNESFREAAVGPMRGIVAISDTPLVSSDYIGCPYSSVVDSPMTQVMEGRLAKVLAWYDNEMGFAQRVVDTVRLVASQL